jgi:hypothetical protein
MNRAVRGGRACLRAALLAAGCAVSSGCLVFSWNGAGSKPPETGKSFCRSCAYATFDADLPTVRQASRHALAGLDMTLGSDSDSGDGSTIEATNAAREKVTIELKQDGPRTAVSVQMTTDGDGATSRQVVRHVEAYLAGMASAASAQPPAVLPASATAP